MNICNSLSCTRLTLEATPCSKYPAYYTAITRFDFPGGKALIIPTIFNTNGFCFVEFKGLLHNDATNSSPRYAGFSKIHLLLGEPVQEIHDQLKVGFNSA